jgi:hypothetical protein
MAFINVHEVMTLGKDRGLSELLKGVDRCVRTLR